jgi:hypothetical protein
MADDKEIQFQQLSTEELRETGTILPALNGLTVWRKFLQCDYCFEPLDSDYPVYLLQTLHKPGLHLMCGECWSSTASSSSGADT